MDGEIMYEHPSQLQTVGEILDLIQQLQDEKDSIDILSRAKNVGIEFIKIAMGEIPIVGGALGAADGLFAMYAAGKNEEHTWAELEEYPILARMKMHPDVAKHLDPITLREIDKAYQQYLSTLGLDTRVTDIKDIDVFTRDWIMTDTGGNLNVELLREYVRVLLREAANEYSWEMSNKKNMLLDKEGMEQSDKDNQEEYLKSMGLMESLLSESARGLTDLRKQGYYVKLIDDGFAFEIELHDSRPDYSTDIGTISATRYDGGLFQCMNSWMITWAKVHERGWGPLLYDLAMEYATIKGTGLMSDRQTVSDEAQNVWRYYMANRGNVEQVQMDDWDNHLTPDDSDNCDQAIAYEQGLPSGTFWDSDNEETPWDPYGKEVLLKSPISKMYRWKGMSKITALKKMGRWIKS
jgi:hypothetical protein